jgi:hypothetical protein
VPLFSPFFLAILETYGIQAIHLHPKSVTLLAVFAYACKAWIDIKPSVAYFCHLFFLRSSGLNQSSGCVSFIATAGTEGDFIDLKWMKKVEDFRSHWLFIDILEELELFLVTGVPPTKLTTWASEALSEEALKTLAHGSVTSRRPVSWGPWLEWSLSPDALPLFRTTAGTFGGTGLETTFGFMSVISTPTLGKR